MHQLKQVTETRRVKTQFDLPLSTLPQQYRAWHRTGTGSEKKKYPRLLLHNCFQETTLLLMLFFSKINRRGAPKLRVVH